MSEMRIHGIDIPKYGGGGACIAIGARRPVPVKGVYFTCAFQGSVCWYREHREQSER